MNAALKRRILVVQGDALEAKAVGLLALRLGYEVGAVVDNAEDAQIELRSAEYDLVLLEDVIRGPVDSAALAVEIRDRQGLPVVFVARLDDLKRWHKIKESDPYGVVMKPVEEMALRVQLDLALHRRAQERERELLRPGRLEAHARLRAKKGEALLPICAGCKKISGDDGRWSKLEEYFARHADVHFTHSFCPECETRLYGAAKAGEPSEAPERRG